MRRASYLHYGVQSPEGRVRLMLAAVPETDILKLFEELGIETLERVAQLAAKLVAGAGMREAITF